MKKVPEELGRFSAYEGIKTALSNALYDSLTVKDFDEHWKQMIDKYNLSNNEWLEVLYNNRHRWVPVYMKDTFWAGM